jgi:hypothetical protein
MHPEQYGMAILEAQNSTPMAAIPTNFCVFSSWIKATREVRGLIQVAAAASGPEAVASKTWARHNAETAAKTIKEGGFPRGVAVSDTPAPESRYRQLNQDVVC